MKAKRIVALTLLTGLLMGCQQADETAKNDQSTVELIQTDDSWGIALSSTDVSNTGLTLICSQMVERSQVNFKQVKNTGLKKR